MLFYNLAPLIPVIGYMGIDEVLPFYAVYIQRYKYSPSERGRVIYFAALNIREWRSTVAVPISNRYNAYKGWAIC
jgi:hypothetical protein